MKIRKKGSAIRIGIGDMDRPGDVHYVLIHPSTCWRSTFNSWGKKAEHSIIEGTDGNLYRVTLEQVT
jgi:hypothetical protein